MSVDAPIQPWEIRDYIAQFQDNQSAILEAVRALKPAPILDGPAARVLWEELVDKRAEVERLRAEIAEAWESRGRAINEYTTWLSEKDAKVAELEAENAELREKVDRYMSIVGDLDLSKPPEGFAQACTAEDTDVLSDSYAEFVKPSEGT